MNQELYCVKPWLFANGFLGSELQTKNNHWQLANQNLLQMPSKFARCESEGNYWETV